MTIERLDEYELKKRMQELHHKPSKHYSIIAIVPIQFTKIGDAYVAKYFDFYYNFVSRK